MMPLHETLYVAPAGNKHDLMPPQETPCVAPDETNRTQSKGGGGVPYRRHHLEIQFLRHLVHTITEASADIKLGQSPPLPNSCTPIGRHATRTTCLSFHHPARQHRANQDAVKASLPPSLEFARLSSCLLRRQQARRRRRVWAGELDLVTNLLCRRQTMAATTNCQICGLIMQ